MHDGRDIKVLKGGEEKKGIANEKRDKEHVLTDSSDCWRGQFNRFRLSKAQLRERVFSMKGQPHPQETRRRGEHSPTACWILTPIPTNLEGKGRRPCRRHVYFMRPITVIWSLAFCSTWAGLQTAPAKVALHTRALIIAFSSSSRTQSTFEQSCSHMSMKWWGKAWVEVSLIALMWARVHLR